jgi:tetratricopeptide (TPR) repeat protein
MKERAFPSLLPLVARCGPRRVRRVQTWLVGGLALLFLAGCNAKPKPPAVSPVQTYYDRGIDLLRKNDVAGAKSAFETALRLDTGYAPAHLALANIAVNTGDLPGAITQLETLQRAAPQTPHLFCRLAQLHRASGSFLEDMTAAKLAHEREPDCPRADMQYGLMLVGMGSLKEATTYLQRAHQKEPDNPRITLEFAQLLARDGKAEDAWKLLDTLPSPSVMPVQEDTLRGRLMGEVGQGGKRDDKKALALLQKALALSPDDGPANLEKGRILLRTGDAQGAFKCLQKAAHAMPPSVDLLSSLAQAGKQLKKPGAVEMEQSAQKFGTIIDDLYVARRNYLAEPNNRANQMRLARLEAAIGNGHDAAALVTQVLKQNPNDTEALQLLSAPEKDPLLSGKPGPQSPGNQKPKK